MFQLVDTEENEKPRVDIPYVEIAKPVVESLRCVQSGALADFVHGLATDLDQANDTMLELDRLCTEETNRRVKVETTLRDFAAQAAAADGSIEMTSTQLIDLAQQLSQ